MSTQNPQPSFEQPAAQPNQQFAAGQPDPASYGQQAPYDQQTPYGQQAPAPYGQQNPYGGPDQQFVGQPGVPGYGLSDPNAPKKWSGMAIGSFVIGLVVLCISLFSGYAIAAILPIALGVAALRDIKSHGKKGKALAIVGLVFGGISAILYLIGLILG
ncbi:DUF4190 domain-containing protein [Microlunatus elymi]|uniref:DUF4190 domain-containing protein n=1 Tax=Microlunatus elymi TaxID=2596828 RepID=A0A516Q4D4_9ACTN|nr:DUF4190 domain-containing protein [Microlunatus elymi]QDP98306.1 DUF4190 domain-containing protein [Microlunatus elymi]